MAITAKDFKNIPVKKDTHDKLLDKQNDIRKATGNKKSLDELINDLFESEKELENLKKRNGIQ